MFKKSLKRIYKIFNGIHLKVAVQLIVFVLLTSKMILKTKELFRGLE
jgi:hypothetical protein